MSNKQTNTRQYEIRWDDCHELIDVCCFEGLSYALKARGSYTPVDVCDVNGRTVGTMYSSKGIILKVPMDTTSPEIQSIFNGNVIQGKYKAAPEDFPYVAAIEPTNGKPWDPNSDWYKQDLERERCFIYSKNSAGFSCNRVSANGWESLKEGVKRLYPEWSAPETFIDIFYHGSYIGKLKTDDKGNVIKFAWYYKPPNGVSPAFLQIIDPAGKATSIFNDNDFPIKERSTDTYLKYTTHI